MTGQQLKNSILQEAIEGRLVPQDPNDEPASVLLERIRAEKARLVKEKNIKKDKNESRIYRTEDGHWMEHFEDKSREDVCIDEEIPFEIPEGWEWCRWGMLGDYKKGPFGSSLTKSMFIPKSMQSIKVYEQKNAIQKDFSLGDYYISTEKYAEMKGFTVLPGDIIVSCAGTIGETYKIPEDAPLGIINQALMRARLFDESFADYWMLYFRYILVIENKLKGAGSAIKNIPPFDVLKMMLVAIPPMHEQKRILCKIKKLNILSDAYGKAQEELEKLNEVLPEQLKKSILQEAIEGHLVPQDPNDESASVLLERIRAEKARLVKEKKIKKDKNDKNESRIYRTEDGHWMEHFEDKSREDVCIDDEIPFDVPSGWEWCRLKDLGITETGTTPSKSHPEYFGDYIPFIGPGNIQNNNIVCITQGISKEGLDYCRVVPPKTILQVCIGGSIGKIAIANKNLAFNQQINSITPHNDVHYLYLFYTLSSDYFVKQILEKATGTATPIINRGNWELLFIPLPPFAEQHRIVEKIEALLPKIEKLKVKK